MIIAAGFTLLKLLNSFFANQIGFEYGRQMFNRTIWAIRSISVTTNDLPSRLAEVLAQLWRGSGAALRHPGSESSTEDNSLQLKVKCRMSMSLVYDSVWRWREEFQAQGKGNLECLLPHPPKLIHLYFRRGVVNASLLFRVQKTQPHSTIPRTPIPSWKVRRTRARLQGPAWPPRPSWQLRTSLLDRAAVRRDTLKPTTTKYGTPWTGCWMD